MTSKPPAADELSRLRARVAELEQALASEPDPSSEHGRNLIEREAMLGEAERIAQLGCWVWDAAAGEVTWSDEFYRILGYDPLTTEPTSENFLARVHPDDLERLVANSQQLLAGASRERIRYGRGRIVRPDGEIRHVEVGGRALLSPDGSLRRIIGTVRDISDQLSTKEALDDARTMLAAIGRMDGLGTWIWQVGSERVEWSHGMFSLLGVSREFTPTLARFMAAVHPEDRAMLQRRIGGLMAHGSQGRTPTTFRMIREDGEPRHVLGQGHLLPQHDGQPPRLAGILLDITERHNLETQLRQAQKMEAVGALAGGVAHDVNNYLTVALGNSELLSLDLPEDDGGQVLLGEIIEASQRCRLLIQRLLAFSRQQVFAPRVFALNELVQDVAGLVGRLVGDNIRVTMRLSSGVGNVRADRTQIEQVLVNLGVNARDAMPEGGRLILTSDRLDLDEEYCATHTALSPGPYLRLTISDSGEGIPLELQQRVFEPFFTTKGTGTGLGLSTASGIIKQSGGALQLYSEPGCGAAFKIYLPAVLDEAERAAAHDRGRRELRRGSGTILLVEDQQQVRQVICSQLERGGYTVLAAANSDEAVTLVAAYPGVISLMLSDMMMPGQSGPQCARQLRELRPELVVGYISGYTAERFTGQPGLAEVSLLQKPFTIHALLDWVAELLER